VIALFPFMKRLTFAIACGVLLGCGDDAPDQRSLLHLFHTMTKGLFHLPINLPGTPYRKALAASPAIRERLQVWIDRRRLELTAARSHRPDILSHLIQYNACPDDDPQRATSTTSTSTTSTFSDNEIKDIVLHLIFAGHDSSTVVAAMTCKYLASHPAIMDAVYKGIVVRKKDISNVCSERPKSAHETKDTTVRMWNPIIQSTEKKRRK
jgi:cytochrome P450 family 26 subfamily A